MLDEVIVYVDEDGRPTGETAPKLAAHTASTKLHLAFSCYIFNQKGELLVTQRAHRKKVWPGVWTNSVCGHPGVNESMTAAIARRLDFELGMEAAEFQLILPRYTYKTPPFKGIIEHEFCPVFVATAKSEPRPNPAEVAKVNWLGWTDFVKLASADRADDWSWWCKDQIKHLEKNRKFRAFIAGLG